MAYPITDKLENWYKRIRQAYPNMTKKRRQANGIVSQFDMYCITVFEYLDDAYYIANKKIKNNMIEKALSKINTITRILKWLRDYKEISISFYRSLDMELSEIKGDLIKLKNSL